MTPEISVFTPTHDPRWLHECYESLTAQTITDWEWVIGLNNGARWAGPDDLRVHVRSIGPTSGVGEAKAKTFQRCSGAVLVELDHDDLLLPTALERVLKAFADRPDAALVYSDFAEINEHGDRRTPNWDQRHGWEFTDQDGHARVSSMAPTPHNVSLIWYAPNHLRAFSRTAYEAAGGYDPARTVCDDADIMCRLYQHGPFHRIDELLYLQRVHAGNTQSDPERNAQIQRETLRLYDTHVQANALAWAGREGLLALDLGAAHGKPAGYIGLDLVDGPDVDVTWDVQAGLPFPDQSVGVIRAVDFLEHITDSVGLLNECHRVLAHGGLLLSLTPSTDGRGAFQDPTHVSFWNENSFWYYTDQSFRQYVSTISARFQTSRLATFHPTDWHREHDISYVNANLIALHDGSRQGGLCHI